MVVRMGFFLAIAYQVRFAKFLKKFKFSAAVTTKTSLVDQHTNNFFELPRLDTNDLPLNISRELLQSNATIERIKSGCVKRVLSTLEKCANNDPENYKTFWKAFGSVIKEGPAEDMKNKERIAKLLRFSSTHADQEEQTVTLDDYISRMKPEQDKIYYLI